MKYNKIEINSKRWLNLKNLPNEIWKDIEGYENKYQVSNYGRIKSFNGWNGHHYTNREKILKISITVKNNYKRCVVTLNNKKKRKNYKVHRLVAKAFIPNLNNLSVVNHIDGNTLNNTANNLEWCTQRDNIIHSYKFLRKKKYNEEEIIKEYIKGFLPKEILLKHNISTTILYKLLKKHNIKINGRAYYNNKYNINLEELLYDFKKGKTNKYLQNKYKCSKDIIATRKYQFRKKGLI